MKRLVSLALSVILLAIPASAMARGGHGHGGHGQGGIVALPFALPFGFYDGPLYYYDPLGVYPSDALIYDPQSGMVWYGCRGTGSCLPTGSGSQATGSG